MRAEEKEKRDEDSERGDEERERRYRERKVGCRPRPRAGARAGVLEAVWPSVVTGFKV